MHSEVLRQNIVGDYIAGDQQSSEENGRKQFGNYSPVQNIKESNSAVCRSMSRQYWEEKAQDFQSSENNISRD